MSREWFLHTSDSPDEAIAEWEQYDAERKASEAMRESNLILPENY